jgi:hypothetical protein
LRTGPRPGPLPPPAWANRISYAPSVSAKINTVDHFDNPLDVNISATSNGEVFCMFSGNFDGTIRVGEYDQHNNLISHALPPRDSVTTLSVAGPDDVFVITSDGSLQEHATAVPNGSWLVWT